MTTVRDITYSDTIAQAEELLESIDAAATFPDRLRRVSLFEAWFSDHLAWLLDTRAGSRRRSARFVLRRAAISSSFTPTGMNGSSWCRSCGVLLAMSSRMMISRRVHEFSGEMVCGEDLVIELDVRARLHPIGKSAQIWPLTSMHV